MLQSVNTFDNIISGGVNMKHEKIYKVDKAFILDAVRASGYTVVSLCKDLNCTRVNFYAALRRTYTSKGQAKFLKRVVEHLNLTLEDAWL